MWDRSWRSKANLEVAKRNLPKVSLPDWEAAPPLPARLSPLCTNIQAVVYRSIISIFFASKTDNRSRGLDSMITFLATEFR